MKDDRMPNLVCMCGVGGSSASAKVTVAGGGGLIEDGTRRFEKKKC